VSDRLFGFVGRQKRGEDNILIQRWLLANLPGRSGEGVLNLKDLLAVSPPSGARPFRSCGATETWRGLSVGSRRVGGEVSEENGRSSAQSKGLASRFSAELSGDL